MKDNRFSYLWRILAVCMVLLFMPVSAYADASPKGVIVWGENLSETQQKNLLSDFQLRSTDRYEIMIMTNQEEQNAFSDYLSSAWIGTQSISAVLVKPSNTGTISIQTVNIEYCSEEMYRNALATAGVKNSEIIIAAPLTISGSCALLSAMRGYEKLTGEDLREDRIDAAIDELVSTGKLGDEIHDAIGATALMNGLKLRILDADNLADEMQILTWIENESSATEVELTEEQQEYVLDLMIRFRNLELEPSDVNSQVGVNERTQTSSIQNWFRNFASIWQVR